MSLLSVVGVMMSVSPALIGMTVLGIGNGTCDMVANYLMARAGYVLRSTFYVFTHESITSNHVASVIVLQFT